MSKYIIDTETWANLFEVQRVGVYGIGNDIVTDEKTVWSRMFRLDELEELNSDYINEHYGELQDEAYQAGMDKAWQLANDVLYDRGNILDILGCDTSTRALDGLTPREIVEKLEAYEKSASDRIEVGDEVEAAFGTAVVTYIEEETVGYLYSTGTTGFDEPRNIKKTGKHYDIQSILEAMRE